MSGVSSTFGNKCCVLQSIVNRLMGGWVVMEVYIFYLHAGIYKVIKMHKNKICNTC